MDRALKSIENGANNVHADATAGHLGDFRSRAEARFKNQIQEILRIESLRILRFQQAVANRVLPNEQVFAEVLAWAQKLAAKPPMALLATRRLIREGSLQAARDAIASEAAEFRHLLQSAEAKEAFAAFIEKRKPDFSRF